MIECDRCGWRGNIRDLNGGINNSECPECGGITFRTVGYVNFGRYISKDDLKRIIKLVRERLDQSDEYILKHIWEKEI